MHVLGQGHLHYMNQIDIIVVCNERVVLVSESTVLLG